MIELYCLICFVLNAVVSYLANWVNVSVIGRKPFKAVSYSLMTGLSGWAVLLIIGKLSDWNIYIMIASVIGDALGDYIVASRKLKKKPKSYYIKKVPFTNA